MCGIAGYIGKATIIPERLNDCLARMRRRGPDSAQYRSWTNASGRNIYLLHSRLSIIDLDPRSNQPMSAGRKWMALNGELYNYVERRKELESNGVSFTTTSDTEVLLKAVDCYGWKVLDRCEGMWAFGLYDQEDGSLTLCRDRFGEKPLYLFRDSTGLYFGSEIKFIQALLGRKMEVNLDHICRYIVNGYKALYKTRARFFKGLDELTAASTLRVDADGRETISSYWTPEYKPVDAMTYGEAVEGAKERLIQSVKLRLRADVPLAFCMSGGVDSNALISIAKRMFGYDVHGFTIMNHDSRYEETDLVQHAVKELGIMHTAIPVNTANFLPQLRELVKYHDAPVYTITYYAHWLLQRSIAENGYRISVSGTAADELFTGYYDHHLAYLYEVRDEPGFEAARASWLKHIKPIVMNPFLGNPELFIRNPEFRDHIFLEADMFRKYLHADWMEPFAESKFTDSLLRNRMMNELFVEAVPVILHEDDLNAMYYSIENRSPFLDRELFDFCYSIPSRHLIRDGAAKAVLRDSMRGIAPAMIMENRRKVGFNAPIFDFLDVDDPTVRSELLDDSPVFELVNRSMIERLLDRDDLPNSESKFLFNFLNSKIFLEEFA